MGISTQDSTALKLAVQSLRQFSRADIRESRTGESLVDRFYEDPYASGYLLSEVKSERHSFVVGRRGSGKSTVFEKARLDLRAEPSLLTAYVNLKSVGMSADGGRFDLPEGAAGRHARQVLWFRGLIKHLLKELSGDLRKKNSEGFFRILTGEKGQVARALRKLEDENRYLAQLNLDLEVQTTVDIGNIQRTEAEFGGRIGLSDISVGAGVSRSHTSVSNKTTYGTRYNIFEVDSFVSDLRGILKQLGVRRLYLFLDDFSELDDAAMGFLIDEVIQPIAALGGDFLTLKIAAYPSRIYTGRLDGATFDILRTDFAEVHSLNPTGTIEERGAQFIERVLKKRLEYYAGRGISHFFALSSHPPLFELLFQASFANIRSLGNILHYAFADATAHLKKITIASVDTASRKHFEDTIGRDLRQFGDAGGTRQVLGQLQLIVDQLKRLCLSTSVHDGVGRPIKRAHASHFFVRTEHAGLLDALTQLKTVHHYTNTRTVEGVDVSVFALDLGKCQLENIPYGRPPEARTNAYFTQAEFDLTGLLVANQARYVEASTPITTRAHAPSFAASTTLGAFKGITGTQQKILDAMFEAGPRVSLLARQIASAIDLSPALVGKVAAELHKNGLIVRARAGQVYSYQLAEEVRAEIVRSTLPLD